jgi:hypothetical protein
MSLSSKVDKSIHNKKQYIYTVVYYHKDGTAEEYEIETERNLDIDSEEVSFLYEVVK